MAIKCPKCQSENSDTARFCSNCAAPLHPSEEISAPTETLEAAREELTTGSTFANRYQIIEELGKGGMGKVYKVHDTEIKEKVALKLLNPEIAADKRTIERFRNEIKLARKIVHKNVGRMYDLGREKDTYYISMEYVPGEDLKSLVRRVKQLTVGTAVSIAKQVCEGLSEAHELGIVHRDLKPSNIMIDKEGNARIMDFGIARSVTGKGITGAGVMIGTPEYMSPEQAEVKEVDQRSDIYSLGVILYEMVIGRVPFEGETPLGIAMKHKSEMPKEPKEINAQIPEDLNRVILKCMEKDKEKRYQSAGEVRSELTNIEKSFPAAERVVPKRKPITSKEITVTLGLKKLLIPALVVIAVVIAGVIVWRLIPQKEIALAPKIENSIAVISFKNQTGDKAYDYLREAIPNLLITNLENTGLFYVATWERMHDLLIQMGNKDVRTIDNDLGFKLCRREGIEFIVLGSFIKAGDAFATDVKVLDVETKKLLKSVSSRGEGIDSILRIQIDELSKEIARGMGIAGEKLEETQLNIEDVTTSSIEAYKYYLEGREASRKLYWEKAARFYEKAVEIDPTFALAYMRLGVTYYVIDNSEASIHAYEKAKAFSSRATEKERMYIEADYSKWVEKDLEKCNRILLQMAEKYPKEKTIHYSLGSNYQLFAGDPIKAIEEYKKALEIDPNYDSALNMLGYCYIDIEDYGKAVEIFKKYVSINPGDPNPLDSLGEAYFLTGKIEEAIAKYQEALEAEPVFIMTLHNIQYVHAFKEEYPEALKYLDKYLSLAPSRGNIWWGYLWKGFYHYWLGTMEKSLVHLHKAKDLALARGNMEGIAIVNYIKAWIYYDRGEIGLSRQYNEAYLDNFKNASIRRIKHSYYTALYNLTVGFIELREGNIESAKEKLAQVVSMLPELDTKTKEKATFFYYLLLAGVSLAENNIEKAIAVLEKEPPPSPPNLKPSSTEGLIVYNSPFLIDSLAQAYLKKGNLDKAISAYEQLITFEPTSKSRRLIHPKYYYRLAKLYEQKGWNDKAIKHYEKFLDLWKDADPGLPEVEDAKKRLARLNE